MTTSKYNITRRIAIKYRKAGLSIIPIAADSSKAPYVTLLPTEGKNGRQQPTWDQFKTRRPNKAEFDVMFPGTVPMGIGIIGGAVSGGLEIWDFDDAETWDQFHELVEQESPGILDGIPQVASPRPGGGRHLYVWSDSAAGCIKVARDTVGATLIEIKGDGGYAVAAGSHMRCHPSRQEYQHVAGPDICEKPRLTVHQRDSLLAIATSLDCYIPEERDDDGGRKQTSSPDSPGNVFSTEESFDSTGLLEGHGWTRLGAYGDRTAWARPGKETPGYSALSGRDRNGHDRLNVFSSNGGLLKQGGSYSLFSAYAVLEHNSKFDRAALELSRQGYSTSLEDDELDGDDRSRLILNTTRLSDVTVRPLEWIWDGRIPRGKYATLAGDPGLGKGHIAMDIAARVSTGSNWPDGAVCQRGRVLILSAEDDPEDTLKPRIQAVGGDCSRIEVVQSVGDVEGGRHRAVNLSRDIPIIAEKLKQMKDCALLIVDPLSAYMGDTDSHRDSDVRALLAPLCEVLAQRRVAMLVVAHLNENEKGKAIYRTIGSIGIVAAARIAWAVTKDPESPHRRLMTCIKSNVSEDQQGLAYSLVPSDIPDIVRVEWEPGLIAASAEEAMHRFGDRSLLGETKRWLCEWLSAGPRPSKEIIADAREATGASAKTVRRAFEELQGKARKVHGQKHGHWEWCLPRWQIANTSAGAAETEAEIDSGMTERVY